MCTLILSNENKPNFSLFCKVSVAIAIIRNCPSDLTPEQYTAILCDECMQKSIKYQRECDSLDVKLRCAKQNDIMTKYTKSPKHLTHSSEELSLSTQVFNQSSEELSQSSNDSRLSDYSSQSSNLSQSSQGTIICKRNLDDMYDNIYGTIEADDKSTSSQCYIHNAGHISDSIENISVDVLNQDVTFLGRINSINVLDPFETTLTKHTVIAIIKQLSKSFCDGRTEVSDNMKTTAVKLIVEVIDTKVMQDESFLFSDDSLEICTEITGLVVAIIDFILNFKQIDQSDIQKRNCSYILILAHSNNIHKAVLNILLNYIANFDKISLTNALHIENSYYIVYLLEQLISDGIMKGRTVINMNVVKFLEDQCMRLFKKHPYFCEYISRLCRIIIQKIT